MAPVAAFVAGERVCAPQQNRPPRELDQAVAPAFSTTVVRKARPADITPLLELMESLIGGLANERTVRRVAEWRPDSLWTFTRNGHLVGGLAMLMLNAAGRDALLAGRMNTRDPAIELLSNLAETPAAIYLWALAHSCGSDGVLKMLVRLQARPYGSANLYAVPYTISGARFQQRWGFRPVPGHPRQLSEYVRLTNRPN